MADRSTATSARSTPTWPSRPPSPAAPPSTGLGILAAARALKLEFVPLFSEQYQLVIPREHYESPKLAPLLEVLRGPDFPNEVNRLGGYEVTDMGRIIWEN